MMNFILFDVWGVEKIIIYIYIYKLFYIIDIFYLKIKNTTFDLKRWALGGGASIYIYMYIIKILSIRYNLFCFICHITYHIMVSTFTILHSSYGISHIVSSVMYSWVPLSSFLLSVVGPEVWLQKQRDPTKAKWRILPKRLWFWVKKTYLGGGNSNIFWIFTPILGEMIQFDYIIFLRWVETTN